MPRSARPRPRGCCKRACGSRKLYTAFLRKDFGVLEGMRLIVDGVADPGVEGISQYLRSLPELGVDRGLD
jgi:hypothetical protein